MNISIKEINTQKTSGPRAAYQEYPKMMFHENGSQQVIQNPDQEEVLKGRGFSETPPPKTASQKIQVENHPKSMAESTALGEQAAKFDAAYKALGEKFTALHAQFTDLTVQHAALAEAHESLQVEHAALLESKTTPGA